MLDVPHVLKSASEWSSSQVMTTAVKLMGRKGAKEQAADLVDEVDKVLPVYAQVEGASLLFLLVLGMRCSSCHSFARCHSVVSRP